MILGIGTAGSITTAVAISIAICLSERGPGVLIEAWITPGMLADTWLDRKRVVIGGGTEMERVRCIAVDWSGAIDRGYQRKHIWLAEAEAGGLIRLENRQIRDDVVATLVNEIQPGGPVAIGLDFAFSFPQWYLQRRNRQNVRALWDLAAEEGEQWLAGDTWPFWRAQGLNPLAACRQLLVSPRL